MPEMLVGNNLFFTNIKRASETKETVKNCLILPSLLSKMQNLNIPKSVHKIGML